MKVHIQQYVQDRWTAEQDQSKKIIEGHYVEVEPCFLDGPVTPQVAVVDFDPATGQVVPGAKFRPQEGKKPGRYEFNKKDLNDPHLNQACVFGTVYFTIRMFEEKEALGRPVTWAFGAPQLLVVPRAGEMKNAYYERDSHSLQFFFFTPGTPKYPDQVIYTSQSRDIITHETSHAILDGIAPALYNAVTPQSLALHEGFADLMALLSSFESADTVVKVLKETGGSIDCTNNFSQIAEEFGTAIYGSNLQHYLRNLYNQRTLDQEDRANRVTTTEPHDLCQVLTGALYAVIVQRHKEWTARSAARYHQSEFSASGKALKDSAEQFKRRLVRALDYLPVGEVSFADYGRAIIAADQFSHPDQATNTLRSVLIDEFVRRKIVPNPDALKVEFEKDVAAVKNLDLAQLKESDREAHQFVNKHRELLHIPPKVEFKVEPRLDVSKTYWQHGEKLLRECLLKVSWYTTEPNNLGGSHPSKRKVQVGTTLAIDWETRQINSLLTSNHVGELEGEEQCQARTALLRRMAEDGLLVPDTQTDPYGKELHSAITYAAPENVMRVLGAAKMLHILKER